MADRNLAASVARHKSFFFREKDFTGNWISYEHAVAGKLQLVPSGSGHDLLAEDYRSMIQDLMDACADLERRANSR